MDTITRICDLARHRSPVMLWPDLRAEHADDGSQTIRTIPAGVRVPGAGDDAFGAKAPGAPGAERLRNQQLRAVGAGVPTQSAVLVGRQLHRTRAQCRVTYR